MSSSRRNPMLPRLAMSVRGRLVLTFIAMGFLLLGPAIYGLQRLARLRDIALELRGEQATASLAVGRLRGALAELDLYQRSYIATADIGSRAAMQDAFHRVTTAVETLRRAGYRDATEALARGRDSIAAATGRIDQLVRGGQPERATESFRALRLLIQDQDSTLTALAAEIDRRSTGVAGEARDISANAEWMVLLGVLGSAMLAFALGTWTTRAITVPILRLRRAMGRVARGKFEKPARLPYERRDEFGDLSRSFRSMTEQLAELERLRAEFMSVASHELKTPVQVISAYAQLIEHELAADPDDDRAEMLRILQTQVKGLGKMVNQLLDLSRLEAGADTLDLTDVELDAMLDAIQLSFEAVSRQEGIRFHIERDPAAPATIIVDEDHIKQTVLGNLLSNAFKFTEPGGCVTLRVGGETGWAWIEVSDTGRGIPTEDVPHVFEKYYQLTRRDRKHGAGLGLALARAVARAHGGDISVESEVGKGSTFRVTLPLKSTVDGEVVEALNVAGAGRSASPGGAER